MGACCRLLPSETPDVFQKLAGLSIGVLELETKLVPLACGIRWDAAHLYVLCPEPKMLLSSLRADPERQAYPFERYFSGCSSVASALPAAILLRLLLAQSSACSQGIACTLRSKVVVRQKSRLMQKCKSRSSATAYAASLCPVPVTACLCPVPVTACLCPVPVTGCLCPVPVTGCL